MASKRMRLDLRSFQRQRVAGVVVIAVSIFAALVAAYFVHREAGIARYYLDTGSSEIPSKEMFDKIISESRKPVAVMFESYTCPVCERMYPYWRVLEEQSENLPIDFYHVYFNQKTAEVFIRYGIEETPTFIVFVDGKPVARHVGAFMAEAGNVSDVMLSWALAAAQTAPSTPEGYAREGLKIFNTRCASCHGRLEGLDHASIEKWLEEGSKTTTNQMSITAFPALADKVRKAVSEGKYLHELYTNGFSGLMEAVRSMRSYVPDLLQHEIERTAYLLDYVTAVLENRTPPVFPWMKLANTTPASGLAVGNATGEASPIKGEEEAATGASMAGLVAALTAFASGFVAVVSPCVLPLLVTHVSVVASSRRGLSTAKCVGCGAAAAATTIAVGVLFLVLGGFVASVQQLLLIVVSVAVLAAGLASLLGVPVELQGLVSSRRGGLMGFCAVYGFLALQCNLPLVVGALLLVAGLGLSLGGVVALLALALGIGAPLAALTWLVARGGKAVADKLLAKNEMLTRVGGAFMAVAGLYLLLHSLSLV